MIISDMNADGRPTKSLTLKNLADFVTSTGTGTGTTNKIIKWSDGPAGLLGNSIMNEDVDKIYVDGQLRIGSSSGASRIQVFYGSDSDTSHINNAPQDNQIIGRAGDLIIKNRARARDIVFQADNGEYNGYVDTYFRLDGSMADIGTSSYYTRWGDNSYIAFGDSAGTYPDFYMGHNGGTIFKNHTTQLSIVSKGGIFIENESGGSGDIEISQSVTNADVNITAYNGNYFRADTSAGATIFSKPVEVPLVPAANANAASKQYVDQQIASIPAGLVFKGNWDANANTPTLASGVGTVGNYYVVSVPGNTNLDGITDWEVGDWAVFVEVGGVDKWDKIDQTFVQGAGATGQVTFWNGINSVTGDNDLYWDNSNKRLGIGTTSPTQELDVVGRAIITKNGEVLRFNSSDANGSFVTWQNNSSSIGYIGAGYHLWASPNNIATSFGIRAQTRLDLGIQADVYMTILSSGNVGIGTTSPSAGLQVAKGSLTIPTAGASTSSACFGNDTSDDNYGVVLGANSSGVGYISSQRTDGTATTYNLAIQPNGGNVGIGTTTIPQKLTVDGNLQLNGTFPKIVFSDTNSNPDFTLIGANGYFDIYDETNTTTRMRIDNSGNVGIGTTTPSYNLEVRGTADQSLYLAKTGTTYLKATAGTNAELFTGGSMVLGSGNTERIRIVSTGNVGIGTSTPAAALDVIGRIGLNDGNNNVSVGDLAGESFSTGDSNTVLGYAAARLTTVGTDNVAIGLQALYSNVEVVLLLLEETLYILKTQLLQLICIM
jgi:hypothetical protein